MNGPIEPPMQTGPIERRCTASKRDGTACQRWAIKGGTVCPSHGGRARQVKAAAARRLAMIKAVASLAEVEVEPIGNPLEELAQVAAETRAWQKHLANIVAEGGALTEATMFGEQIKPIVKLYVQALDRTGKFLADWVRLGFDERMVVLHERQAQLVAQVIRGTLDELELTEDQRRRAPGIVSRHLELVKGENTRFSEGDTAS